MEDKLNFHTKNQETLIVPCPLGGTVILTSTGRGSFVLSLCHSDVDRRLTRNRAPCGGGRGSHTNPLTHVWHSFAGSNPIQSEACLRLAGETSELININQRFKGHGKFPGGFSR